MYGGQAVTGRIKGWFMEPIPRYAVLPIYVILLIFAWAGLNWNRETNRRDLAEARLEVVAREYQQCLTRVETRDSLREVFFAITDLFPDSDAAGAIDLLIETEYPPIASEDCKAILAEP